jgi:hypothetical protein
MSLFEEVSIILLRPGCPRHKLYGVCSMCGRRRRSEEERGMSEVRGM